MQAYGTYILILSLKARQTLQIGRLGSYDFRRGFYGYVGSAFGPGGLTARLKHHFNTAVRPHWHIDYLRSVSTLQEVWFSRSDERQEHGWAILLEKMPEVFVLIKGFGSTDCKCTSHLFYFSKRPGIRAFQKALRSAGTFGGIDIVKKKINDLSRCQRN